MYNYESLCWGQVHQPAPEPAPGLASPRLRVVSPLQLRVHTVHRPAPPCMFAGKGFKRQELTCWSVEVLQDSEGRGPSECQVSAAEPPSDKTVCFWDPALGGRAESESVYRPQSTHLSPTFLFYKASTLRRAWTLRPRPQSFKRRTVKKLFLHSIV